MTQIYIGYVQGVHGLRGDLKIKNRFERPDSVFQKGKTIFLNEEAHEITACKFYKGFYLVTIDNLKDINLVEKYVGYDVYFERENLELKEGEYLLDDLYNMEIFFQGEMLGKVHEVLESKMYPILVINGNKKIMIPLNDVFIEKVLLNERKIYCKDIEGLL